MDDTPLVGESMMEPETAKMRKEKQSLKLLNERYRTPNTSLILFHFEPHAYASSATRLKACSIEQSSLKGKQIYIFDHFFSEDESAGLRLYSKNASFSRNSYACTESKQKGEEPARSMTNQEKWKFFSSPPQPIQEVYKLLGMLAQDMQADISTLPWDLCDQHICASAVATNKVERVSPESMEMGKHEDFNTEKGIPFAIPCLYGEEEGFFPAHFVNGACGNPWLISLMVYAAEENFRPEYGMGTIFCNDSGEQVSKAYCQNARFILFEGDILHGIEKSMIPAGIHTWRVSYVFKLIVNPREKGRSMREILGSLLHSYNPVKVC